MTAHTAADTEPNAAPNDGPITTPNDGPNDGPNSGPATPRPHTGVELAALVGLLTTAKPGIETVAIGHSRDDASRAAAYAFAESWRARGGTVLAEVDWPESAASWLRPARRLTAQTPDAWVIAAAVPGFARLARRLRQSTDFDPARTVAFASLGDPHLPALAGPGTLDGLRGATADGGTWDVQDGWLTSPEPNAASRKRSCPR
ncbi:ABC transporter substrate-binding protein [Kitasatospora sp. NPDC097691]|uniref:ABC transporter substrate-binding protein n=1 Tax=Kitasatospora sp. NPDC097691 TaxID=3157231 RepID=UPI00332E55B7